jgi:uncharacterized damage-inducible protein DinB
VNRKNIEQLLDYNYWATRRVLAAAQRATKQELHAPATESGSSIHGTLVHIFDAERIWRLRCQGESPTMLTDPASYTTLASLVEAWEAEETAMRTYVGGVSDADLAGEIRYFNTKGNDFKQQLWQILTHVVNHGTQHRAEAAYLLTELGYSPGDVDFILYLRQQQ